MNCRQFQNALYEYLDGSLSQEARAGAEQHISECVACREKLKEERQVAQAIGGSFQRATEALELPPSVGCRVLAEMAEETGAAPHEPGIVLFWHRLRWPLALATAALLLIGSWVILPHKPGSAESRAHRGSEAQEVSVQLSYVVPAYTFRLEGGFVTDALSYHTYTVNERLSAHPGRSQ
jgi:anti-sigma factor RsiW